MAAWKSIVAFLGVLLAYFGMLFISIPSAQAVAPLSSTFSATAPTDTLGTIRHVRVDPSDGKVYILGSSTSDLGFISADGSTFSTLTYDSALPSHTGSDLAVSQGRLFIVTNGSSGSSAVYRYDVSGSMATRVAVNALNTGSQAITFNPDSNTVYTSKGISLLSHDIDLNRIAPTSTLSFIPTRLAYAGGELFYLSTSGRFGRVIVGESDTTIATGGPSSVTVKGLAVSSDGSALYYANTTSLVKLSLTGPTTLWTKAISNLAGIDVSAGTGRITIVNSSGTVATYDPITPLSSLSSSASGTSALLSWTTGIGDSDFRGVTIRRSTTSYPATASDGTAVTSSSLATNFIDTELDEGTYYYSFFNQTSDGYYSSAATSTVTVDLPPSAPILTAEAADSSISLSWSVPADTASFVLRRSMSDYPTSHTDGVAVTTTHSSITSLTESGMIDGAYFYSIFAADASGNYSAAGTASVTVDTTAPAAPILSASASGSSIALSWDVPATTVSFMLRRSTSDFPATISSGTGVTSTTDTSLVQADLDDGPYYYSIFARDSYGNYSNAGTASTTIDTTSPAPPTSFSAVASGNTIHLTWVNPFDWDFASSTIRRSTSGYPTSNTDGTAVTTTSATSHTHTSLADGTYYYSIFALDRTGNVSSAATSSAIVNTYVPPAAPAASTGGGGGSSSVAPSAINAAPLRFSVSNAPGTSAAKRVSSPAVTLKLNANPATVRGYAASLDSSFKNASIFPLTTTGEVTLSLPEKAGTYTVYLKYYSTTGESSEVLTQTVTYAPILRQTERAAEVKVLQGFLKTLLKPSSLEKGTGVLVARMRGFMSLMR